MGPTAALQAAHTARTTSAPTIDPALVQFVRAHRAETERLRHLSPAVVEAIAAADMLQLFLPRALGGPQRTPLEAFASIEAISRADGSAGWCAMIASLFAMFTGWLDPSVGREIAGDPPDCRAAGSLRPQGRAHRVAGGYRVEGHWDFASGINHARWLGCPCVLMEDGKPIRTDGGAPATRMFWIPAERATVQDTWRVMGLRGTGSNDFTVEDVFVADAFAASASERPRHDGLLYEPRLLLTWAWTATVANALGIARGAIDEFITLASGQASTSSATVLRDRPQVQIRIAQAEAILGAARAYVVDTVATAWTLASEGRADLDAPIAQARLAITHGMHEAARCVDLVFHAAGTSAIYERNPLERYFRDIHVTLQHGAALPGHFESAGKALLGLRPSDPCW